MKTVLKGLDSLFIVVDSRDEVTEYMSWMVKLNHLLRCDRFTFKSFDITSNKMVKPNLISFYNKDLSLRCKISFGVTLLGDLMVEVDQVSNIKEIYEATTLKEKQNENIIH